MTSAATVGAGTTERLPSDIDDHEHSWLFARPRPLLLLAVAVFGAALIGAAVGRKPLDGVALFLGLVMVICVAARPALGAYLLAVVVPITSGFEKGFPIPNVNLSEALVAMVGTVVILAEPRRAQLRWQAFDWILLAYCSSWLAFGLLDAVQLHSPINISTLDPLIGPFQFLILYRAMAGTLRRHSERTAAIACVLVASLPVDILAFLQQVRSQAVNRLISHMTGGSVFTTYSYQVFARATGPFPHWTVLAGYLLVILLIGFACLVFGVELPVSRRFVSLILLFAAVALILTAEISAISGAIGGAVLLGIWAGKRKQMVKWLVTGMIVAAVFGGSYFAQRLNDEFASSAGSGRNAFVPQTISYRWQVWTSQYFPAVEQRPLTGWGQTLPATISFQYTESQYLTTLMAGGVPVLALFCGEMVAFYALSRRIARRKDLEDHATAAALGNAVAALVVVLVPMDAIYPYLTSGGLPEPLFVAAGIAMACVYWDRGTSALGPRGDREAEPRLHPVLGREL